MIILADIYQPIFISNQLLINPPVVKNSIITFADDLVPPPQAQDEKGNPV